MFIKGNTFGAGLSGQFSVKLERIALFYSYRFNIASGNRAMPFSLMHQTGLNFSFNNVEKRIKGRTINAPDV